MKKCFKVTTAVSLLIIMALSFTGCTTFDNFKAAFIDKPQKETVKIQVGVLEPVTGADSQAAEDEIRGIQLANKVHPNVKGKMISLVFADNKSDIDATETAVQTLIAKEPLVILGSYGNIYSMAASPYIKEAKIPAIAITNTNPLVTKHNPYYYRVCYVDSNQGDLLARYVLTTENKNSVGVLIPSGDDAALAMTTAFTDRMKAETGNSEIISYYEKYDTGQKDFSIPLKQMKNDKVKPVLLPGEYTDAANIINQAAEMGLDVNFLGDTTWGGEDFRRLLSNKVKSSSLSFVQFFATEGNVKGEAITAEREKFLKEYYKEYGKDSEPSDAMALGYDAYFVVIDTINKASDNVTSEEVNEILSNPQYSYEGATGMINFNSNGDPIKTAYISTWQGSKLKTIYTIESLSLNN